jgi:hypothetical protein
MGCCLSKKQSNAVAENQLVETNKNVKNIEKSSQEENSLKQTQKAKSVSNEEKEETFSSLHNNSSPKRSPQELSNVINSPSHEILEKKRLESMKNPVADSILQEESNVESSLQDDMDENEENDGLDFKNRHSFDVGKLYNPKSKEIKVSFYY